MIFEMIKTVMRKVLCFPPPLKEPVGNSFLLFAIMMLMSAVIVYTASVVEQLMYVCLIAFVLALASVIIYCVIKINQENEEKLF